MVENFLGEFHLFDAFSASTLQLYQRDEAIGILVAREWPDTLIFFTNIDSLAHHAKTLRRHESSRMPDV